MLSDDHHNIHTVQKFDRDNNNINLNKILTKCEQNNLRDYRVNGVLFNTQNRRALLTKFSQKTQNKAQKTKQ